MSSIIWVRYSLPTKALDTPIVQGPSPELPALPDSPPPDAPLSGVGVEHPATRATAATAATPDHARDRFIVVLLDVRCASILFISKRTDKPLG
jgi:hypothetical protein